MLFLCQLLVLEGRWLNRFSRNKVVPMSTFAEERKVAK